MEPPRFLVCPTAFKGTLTPRQAGEAIAQGILRALPEAQVTLMPVADGGDGFLECLAGDAALHWREVSGSLGESVRAPFAFDPDGSAIIEMARVSGLALLGSRPPDPIHATTRGVGELMLEALKAGAPRMLLGVGGSATNDGGAGCLSALGFQLLDAAGLALPDGGGALADLSAVEPPRYPLPNIVCACDVSNPMLGPMGSTRVFGPQKGVRDEHTLALLEEGLAHLASLAPPGSVGPNDPMTGAAGGIAFGLAAFAGAKLVPGSQLVLERLGFEVQLTRHDVVVTGEGKLDGQTAGGKIVGEVLRRARAAGLRTYALCGVLGEGYEQLNDLLTGPPVAINATDGAADALAAAAARLAAGFARTQ